MEEKQDENYERVRNSKRYAEHFPSVALTWRRFQNPIVPLGKLHHNGIVKHCIQYRG